MRSEMWQERRADRAVRCMGMRRGRGGRRARRAHGSRGASLRRCDHLRREGEAAAANLPLTPASRPAEFRWHFFPGSTCNLPAGGLDSAAGCVKIRFAPASASAAEVNFKNNEDEADQGSRILRGTLRGTPGHKWQERVAINHRAKPDSSPSVPYTDCFLLLSVAGAWGELLTGGL